MRILIGNDTLPFPHHGCKATSTALRGLLRSRFPGAEIEADATPSRSVFYFLPVEFASRKLRPHMRGFCDQPPDLLVVNGEGTLHALGRRFKRRNGGFLLRLMQARRALELGVETWIVNHSLFFNRPDYQAMLQDIYPRLAHVALREPCSMEHCRQLRGVQPVQSADCAFLTPLPPPATQSPLADAIVVTDSSVYWNGATLRRIRESLEQLRQKTGRPTVYLSIFTNGQDRRKAADHLGVPYHAFADAAEYLAHLQRAAFVLSGRYHTAVFSALCGIPFVPLVANTPKNTGLLALLEYSVPCINPESESTERMTRTALEQLGAAAGHAAHLTAQRERLQMLARRNVPDGAAQHGTRAS